MSRLLRDPPSIIRSILVVQTFSILGVLTLSEAPRVYNSSQDSSSAIEHSFLSRFESSLIMDYLARSHVEQIGPVLLRLSVNDAIVGGYLQAMTIVALIYDALLTIDREVKYFWKRPNSPVDFIYFVNRYTGILGAVASLSFLLNERFSCSSNRHADWVTITLIDYILTIRVLALYSKDRTVVTCLYVFLALEAVATLAIMLYGNAFDHEALGGAGGVTLCGHDRNIPWWLGIVDWSLELAFGVILMVLALYKAAEYWKLSAGFKGYTLVKVLIEDQVIYFMAVILVSILAMFDFKIVASNAIAVFVLDSLGNPSFLCILGSRVLLNLKEAGERGQNEGTSFRAPSHTISNIEFGGPPGNVEASQTEEAAECGLGDIEFGETSATGNANQTEAAHGE